MVRDSSMFIKCPSTLYGNILEHFLQFYVPHVTIMTSSNLKIRHFFTFFQVNSINNLLEWSKGLINVYKMSQHFIARLWTFSNVYMFICLPTWPLWRHQLLEFKQIHHFLTDFMRHIFINSSKYLLKWFKLITKINGFCLRAIRHRVTSSSYVTHDELWRKGMN